MKILYLSCHSVLEHDEIKLLTELGHDVFSMGAYSNKQGDGKRPPLPQLPDHLHLQDVMLQSSQENVHPEILDWCDVVILMHSPDRVESNWENFKKSGKPIIWRTIGQSIWHVERKLAPYREDGLKIVRYCPLEKNIPNYIGEDATIRFYADPDEYKDWTGREKTIVNFTQAMPQRSEHCHYDLFKRVIKGLPTHLYGPDNDTSELPGGLLSYESHKLKLREGRVYFYTGTQPASYTLGFMEAWMTGIPIVSIGKKTGNSIYPQDTFEVPELIKHGKTGFVSDSPDELRMYLEELLNNHRKASVVGQAGREAAIATFGKDKIKAEWKDFLESL